MKLIRIALIVAIVAGLAVGVIDFVVIKDKITTTQAARDLYKDNWNTETGLHKKFEKLAKDTQSQLDKTNALLVATTAERDAAVQKADDQEKIATELKQTLDKTKTERDAALDKLAAWDALGVPIQNMKATLATIRDVTEKNEAITAENKVLLDVKHKLEEKIASLIDPEHDVILPAGLKGKVLVADPRYDFVVLDIGDKQGVIEDGKLLVNRNGKLIAKVKVKSVQANRCIANVMPGWKLSDVMEGDEVIY